MTNPRIYFSLLSDVLKDSFEEHWINCLGEKGRVEKPEEKVVEFLDEEDNEKIGG